MQKQTILWRFRLRKLDEWDIGAVLLCPVCGEEVRLHWRGRPCVASGELDREQAIGEGANSKIQTWIVKDYS